VRQHRQPDADTCYCKAAGDRDSHLPGRSDRKIIQQLIVEGLVLSLTGAVIGVGLAYLLMPSLLHAAGGVLPPGADVRIDARVLLFTAVLSICAGVFFGIAPAAHIRMRDLRTVLNETERAGSGKRAKLLRNGLVVSEISLALLLMGKRLIFPSGRIGNFVWWWAKCPLILGGHLLGVGR
jgi:hypothetical protein